MGLNTEAKKDLWSGEDYELSAKELKKLARLLEDCLERKKGIKRKVEIWNPILQSMPEMPEYARVCRSMPEYARVCQSMPEYAKVC